MISSENKISFFINIFIHSVIIIFLFSREMEFTNLTGYFNLSVESFLIIFTLIIKAIKSRKTTQYLLPKI